MSFKVRASATTTVLPNPQFSDQEGSTVEVDIKRAQDGTVYTYVKDKGGRRTFQWRFILTREKGLELEAFFTSYFASEVTVTDHNDRVIIGNFTVNPFETRTSGKGLKSITQNVNPETMEVTFEFEGLIQ